MLETEQPMVVDEAMLQQAVEEQGPQGQAGRIAKMEGIELHDVLQLRLDYRHILKIDHLWQFTSLTKLQLDNNIIERIAGLDCLVNLVWLNLSFNHIEVIEGLDALVKLEDLSLSNNSISVIENMDNLANLHVLSICNNKLSQLDNVTYLRKFKNLRALHCSGNVFSTEECYQEFIAAYLPNLAYLDFRLLSDETKEEAMGKYQYALEELIHNETQEQRAIEAQRKTEEEFQQHKEAFVEFLNGPQLFDSMYADDPEAERLAYLPGLLELMGALCTQLFELGLEQHQVRREDVDCFFECFREGVQDNQEIAAAMVLKFKDARREALQEMQRATDPQVLLAQIELCSEETQELHDSLMSLELQLADQLEEIIKDFERNIGDMCRDLENIHNEKILEISMTTMEKVAKNELEEASLDELRALLADKDTVENAVSASHDTHLLKIDNREDELLTRINGWMEELMKKLHHDVIARNRRRIAEIHNYIDYLKDQLDDMRPT
ncbi:hypothetical protein AAFF_G00160730 [Aldrovandia affinis]|uniref:Dynein regulatory complex subunit 3 n=1 Tax=Aldrovandia affinis TaxID=143900 RepID=A0AAD7W8B0_9TELE|nr:hypothetical protein AAFF_G00160730 [Aldrovandia affinis]